MISQRKRMQSIALFLADKFGFGIQTNPASLSTTVNVADMDHGPMPGSGKHDVNQNYATTLNARKDI
jgi:hypothetical protein